jgi:hypothetical protein
MTHAQETNHPAETKDGRRTTERGDGRRPARALVPASEGAPVRDLNHDFKELCRHNRDGSYATQADRAH